MCGVAALVSKKFNPSQHISMMNSALVHRGPNDVGTWVSPDGKVALGQRRLSIVDLSSRGHQPMISNDKCKVISYNGEVYNFPELRKDLESKGYEFKSNTDTEVILNCISEWGIDSVAKLNGMWGFVYYDSDTQMLYASRDRVGIKPLYYFWDGETLAIASEVKAILSTGIVKAEVDCHGLNEYFTFQNIISDRTLFKNIKMLSPGSNLSLNVATGELKISQYWDFNFRSNETRSEADYIEEFLSEFSQSVERHLISDVPVGATISGGMDSSAIVYEASKKIKNLHTFNGYFDTSKSVSGDRSVSERYDAKLVAETFRTKHFEREISWQDQLDTMPMIVWHLEDPKVGMCYTFYNISQLVSSHVTVNLSGTGGDEIFAGYPWRYQMVDGLSESRTFNSTYYNSWSRVVKDDQKTALFTKKVLAETEIALPFDEFKKIISSAEDCSPVNKALYFDAKTFLQGMLMVEDKLGMAFSIETRFPFLDVNLIELAQRIPDSLKFRDGVGKYIFRNAFKDKLPKEIVNKKKQGFTPPDFTYYQGALNQWIRATLLGHRTRCHEYINKKFIEDTIDRLEKGSDERFVIWSLLFFEGWCRTYLADDYPQVRLF